MVFLCQHQHDKTWKSAISMFRDEIAYLLLWLIGLEGN